MIYPKTIFRTVIALSTVAAATQATVASPRTLTNGAKRGKGGRYIDTVDVYEQGTTNVLLNVASPSNYVGVSKTQNDVSLRKVTSPNGTGGKFSAVSPTNAAAPCPEGKGKGKSGQATYYGPAPSKNSGMSPVSSPRTLDGKHGKDVLSGGKGNSGNTVEVPVSVPGGKTGNYGGNGKGGKTVEASVSKPGGKTKGGKDANYGAGVSTSPVMSPKNGKSDKKGNYAPPSPKKNGGKNVEIPVSPSTGRYKKGDIGVPVPPTGSTGGSTTVPPAPISPSTSGKGRSTAGSQAYTEPPASPTKSGGSGSGPKGGNSGSTAGLPAYTQAPNPPSSAGTGSGSKGKGGSVAGSNAFAPTSTPTMGKGSKSGSTGGSKGTTPTTTTPAPTTTTPAPTTTTPAPTTTTPATTSTPSWKQSSNTSWKQTSRR